MAGYDTLHRSRMWNPLWRHDCVSKQPRNVGRLSSAGVPGSSPPKLNEPQRTQRAQRRIPARSLRSPGIRSQPTHFDILL